MVHLKMLDLAQREKVYVAGDDKSNQIQVSIGGFLGQCWNEPTSIASYNRSGSTDGFNLRAPQQFR